MITVGIDSGSVSTKGAIIKDGNLLTSKVIPSGYNVKTSANTILKTLLDETGINMDDITALISTGYGRKRIDFADQSVTEITCHAAGARFQNPEIRSIIDIGGQDCKAILTDNAGKVTNFVMNDKCAAGTGRFLEVMARALEVDLDNFGELSLKAQNPAKISSLCTVFAESEVISLIAQGESRENIIAGIHLSIASRVSAMAGRAGINGSILLTGGVAHNKGVVNALALKTGSGIEIPKHPQVNGAIGAALIAAERSK